MVAFDEMLGPGTRLGVLKLDVEGYELEVLHGMERLLSSRGVPVEATVARGAVR